VKIQRQQLIIKGRKKAKKRRGTGIKNEAKGGESEKKLRENFW